jgi:hypothetical protein
LGQKNTSAVSWRETIRNENIRETVRIVFQVIERVAAAPMCFIYVDKSSSFTPVGMLVANIHTDIVDVWYGPAKKSDQLIVSSCGREHLFGLGGDAHLATSESVLMGRPLIETED